LYLKYESCISSPVNCPKRSSLSKAVALAIQKAQEAKHEYDRVISADMDSIAAGIALQTARVKARSAIDALAKHRAVHGCSKKADRE
jgi:hypothetical protein